ncbi:holo-ACP synthase [Sutcliffiella horikoshii]|uniref:Holo-[acyl-carrier-protein] synthase n=1 Tax=Sutcliffiella horikoshii TaxID=79883 RepID=A0A5D4SJQ1_9BACI|nr:holo-ACP synthase [Sutcliffiella horikoshii]TYS63433.1 holo-ACP synthase [Sutcliffiella horikoshii]
MIIGTGVDIVELGRIEKLMNRQPGFVNRILTSLEKERFSTLSEKRKVEFLAGRFAAKEAFSKAKGTGIGKELSFQDMTIVSTEKGRPYFSEPQMADRNVHLSISHSEQYAIAQVIIESLSS